MSEPVRPPRTPQRAEGDPAGETNGDGRTPHPVDPAEGQDLGRDGADTPD
jgi:ribokinase